VSTAVRANVHNDGAQRIRHAGHRVLVRRRAFVVVVAIGAARTSRQHAHIAVRPPAIRARRRVGARRRAARPIVFAINLAQQRRAHVALRIEASQIELRQRKTDVLVELGDAVHVVAKALQMHAQHLGQREQIVRLVGVGQRLARTASVLVVADQLLLAKKRVQTIHQRQRRRRTAAAHPAQHVFEPTSLLLILLFVRFQRFCWQAERGALVTVVGFA
jgi:hypothetical protein